MLSNKLLISAIRSPSYIINKTQVRTSFYNKYKHGPTAKSNPTPNYVEWLRSAFGKEGMDFFKTQFKRVIKSPFENTMSRVYADEKTYKFEDFDSDESIKQWKPVADSDSLNGYSVCTISRSQNGHCLMRGVLDTRIPDDGLTIKSGFVAIIGPPRPKVSLFEIENHWDWSEFNTLEIKFRGDGRKYHLIANTSHYEDDLSFYDFQGFPLYTRGGPYWQTYRIPFSKFIFANKGLIQDEQFGLSSFAVKFVAISLSDNVPGPFELEIDYIGLRSEDRCFHENTAYESYAYPHLTFRQIQVDCDAPDDA